MDLNGRKVSGLMLALILMVGACTIPVGVAAEQADLYDQITIEDGPTELLGGGNHFLVRFGEDCAFGILWGTEENPNNVYLVSIIARYVGLAQFYDDEGRLLRANHSMKLYTIYAV
ncbi:MAG: hypothetical protein QW520_07685, partial [Methanomassiliicoccales archaeon]